MKWLKYSVLFVLVLVLLVVVASAGGWFMFRGTPNWYQPNTATQLERQQAADRAQNKLIRFSNWAGAARARRLRSASSPPDGPTTTQATTVMAHEPDQPFQIQFTDGELNAFFDKWADFRGRRQAMEKYVQDPRLVLRDNQLILAGTVKELGTVVSMQFEPRIDEQGNLQMNLVRVLGGILPLPDAVWAGQREKVERMLKSKLPEYQQSASISGDGAANPAAASASMNKLLLAVLNRDATDPVVFVPIDVATLARSVPAKITAISIQNNLMTMTVEQMSGPELAALLDRLRAPYATASAE